MVKAEVFEQRTSKQPDVKNKNQHNQIRNHTKEPTPSMKKQLQMKAKYEPSFPNKSHSKPAGDPTSLTGRITLITTG